MYRKVTFYIMVAIFFLFYVQKPLFGALPSAVAGYIQDKKEEERIAEFLKGYSKVDVQHVTIHYVDADEELISTVKLAFEKGIELNKEAMGSID